MSMDAEIIVTGPSHPDLLGLLTTFGTGHGYHQIPAGCQVMAILFRLDGTTRCRALMDELGVSHDRPDSFELMAHRIQWPALSHFANEHGCLKDLLALQQFFHHGFTAFFRPR